MSAKVVEGGRVQLSGAHDELDPTMTVVPTATNNKGVVTLDTISDMYVRARLGERLGGEVIKYSARNITTTDFDRPVGWMSLSVTVLHPNDGIREHFDHVTQGESYFGIDEPTRTILGVMAMAQPTVRVR